MQVDIEKAFGMVDGDFMALMMAHIGFSIKMRNIVYWLYDQNQSSGIDRELVDAWALGCLVFAKVVLYVPCFMLLLRIPCCSIWII